MGRILCKRTDTHTGTARQDVKRFANQADRIHAHFTIWRALTLGEAGAQLHHIPWQALGAGGDVEAVGVDGAGQAPRTAPDADTQVGEHSLRAVYMKHQLLATQANVLWSK